MLQKGIRRPPCGKARPSLLLNAATPRPSAPSSCAAVALAPQPSSRPLRPAFVTQAAALDSAAPPSPEAEEAVSSGPRVSPLRLTAEAETAAAAPMLTSRFIVPHFPTKPGQQLFLLGSTPELGEWDPHLAVPLEWREGHQHTATVRLPASRVVQVKLVLKENGKPVLPEEGSPRDIMLMPVNILDGSGGADAAAATSGADPQQQQQPADATAAAAAAAQEPAAAPTPSRPVGPPVDYQIMCHFGNPDATQVLRLPVVLPAKESGDRRVLCKFVVMLDGLKLEPRQYPMVVGSCEELGSWKAEAGVKLMRQVGGYWTRRVELPLSDGAIQAKVIICNPDGQAALWEPGTANRVLVARGAAAGGGSGGGSFMHIFVCRWSQPDYTAVVSVPVEYERADKDFVKQLDAAQREIGIMRRAVTAKSRQLQSLESELAASRRAERALREEVSGLRNDIAYMMQDVEVAQRGELEARNEAEELRQELQLLGASYERQISFLESKLDEMESEIVGLQEQLASAPHATTTYATTDDNGYYSSSPSSSSSFFESAASHEREEAPRVMTRSNWR
ncbi:hypothetical protein PLESTB_000564600 [Pleodorina starrii]|uniref:CBM20 domain-containing protein n=1 Tax=Pleodorina starrii TaxID=330485 RepID=A0A9W6BHJ8_9CHLO|nr:hypothetical protein PLESTM_000289600 [Pleodorina starrii]GLC51935.1 hypothetical protein PLESTB_000564600 [Pleodorina starrii]GLC68511.1 hypothetical protein PLESTF_000700200 [Pleodorina starrii]